jgi:hypothetical protein
MTAMQKFNVAERTEHELAMERRAMMRIVARTPILEDETPICIFCCERPAEPGSDYCSTVCVIDAEND